MAARNIDKPELGGLLGGGVRAISAVAIRIRRKAAAALLVALTFPVAYKAIYGTHGYLAYRDEVAESHRLEAEINDLNQRNAKVEQSIKELKTDPATIEREARQQLKYVRPNDIVITIPQAQNNTERAKK